jgi:hypothetical protein
VAQVGSRKKGRRKETNNANNNKKRRLKSIERMKVEKQEVR